MCLIYKLNFAIGALSIGKRVAYVQFGTVHGFRYSPVKSTHCSSVTKCACITQLGLTLLDRMDCTLPGSSVHGTGQATISDSRRSLWPRDRRHISCISCIGKWFFTTELPKWDRDLKKSGYVYLCNWFTLSYCRNKHNMYSSYISIKPNRKLKKNVWIWSLTSYCTI